ncbi:hypothetical protein JCM11251_006009 [Rhodosporidiobolus azoricus]
MYAYSPSLGSASQTHPHHTGPSPSSHPSRTSGSSSSPSPSSPASTAGDKPARHSLSLHLPSPPRTDLDFTVPSSSHSRRVSHPHLPLHVRADKPPSEPWFPPHKSRDIYVSLLSLDPPPPRPILVAALLRRAMDDVKLIWSVRDAKSSLTTLLGKGQIGDELWERFLAAEKELEAEILEVVGEANTFEPGYGGKIFNVASDMVSHERWKDVYRDIAKKREEESAKLSSSTPPAPILSPTPYLTPSSLSLSASNPLPVAGSSPAPASTSLSSPSGPAASPPALLAVEEETTSAPPEPESEPVPSPPAPTLIASSHDKPSSSPGDKENEALVSPPSSSPEIPSASSPVGKTPPPAAASSTSTSSKKKKGGKKKPAVKGGR